VTICNQFQIKRAAHATTSSTRPFDSSYPITYIGTIATKSVSPAVFETMGIKHNGVTTLTSVDYVTSSVTWQFDSPLAISYWWSFGPESLSLTVSEIFRPKHYVLIQCVKKSPLRFS